MNLAFDSSIQQFKAFGEHLTASEKRSAEQLANIAADREASNREVREVQALRAEQAQENERGAKLEASLDARLLDLLAANLGRKK